MKGRLTYVRKRQERTDVLPSPILHILYDETCVDRFDDMQGSVPGLFQTQAPMGYSLLTLLR